MLDESMGGLRVTFSESVLRLGEKGKSCILLLKINHINTDNLNVSRLGISFPTLGIAISKLGGANICKICKIQTLQYFAYRIKGVHIILHIFAYRKRHLHIFWHVYAPICKIICKIILQGLYSAYFAYCYIAKYAKYAELYARICKKKYMHNM